MCGGVMEKDLTSDVARRVARSWNRRCRTMMNRLGDSDVSLRIVKAFGNRGERALLSAVIQRRQTKSRERRGNRTTLPIRMLRPLSRFVAAFSRGRPSNSPKPESQSLAGFIKEALVRGPAPSTVGRKPRQFL